MNKRMKLAYGLVKPNIYSVSDAIALIKQLPTAKFIEALDIVISVHKKDKNALRGSVSLPHGIGKDLQVAIFAGAGEVVPKGVAHISEIPKEDFKVTVNQWDRCGASTSGIMIAAKAAQILGPRGLMPSAKNNTVSSDINALVAYLKNSVLFTEKGGNIMTRIGRADMKADEIMNNIKVFCEYIKGLNPENKHFIKACSISTTMGPSIKIDLSTI